MMIDTDSTDPDRLRIEELYPEVCMRVGDPFEMAKGPMRGKGQCIRRRITDRDGVLFTIRFEDGVIKDWEWFD